MLQHSKSKICPEKINFVKEWTTSSDNKFFNQKRMMKMTRLFALITSLILALGFAFAQDRAGEGYAQENYVGFLAPGETFSLTFSDVATDGYITVAIAAEEISVNCPDNWQPALKRIEGQIPPFYRIEANGNIPCQFTQEECGPWGPPLESPEWEDSTEPDGSDPCYTVTASIPDTDFLVGAYALAFRRDNKLFHSGYGSQLYDITGGESIDLSSITGGWSALIPKIVLSVTYSQNPKPQPAPNQFDY
jgi:hypothetical protein